MSGTFLIRSIGALTCMAVIATGWDAEAGWRRHHHRRAACCEPVCCEPVREPVCCEPVRETVCCEPVRETVCCEPVRETVCGETVVVAPVRSCCTNTVVVAEQILPSGQASVLKAEAGDQSAAAHSTAATAAALKR